MKVVKRNFCRYTKTDLFFGFIKNESLVAVIPGLESTEDLPRAKLFLDYYRKQF
jgi:hypothetical protein